MLVDSHCHLDFIELESDIEKVIERAKTSGVEVMQTISTRIRTFNKIHEIAIRFDEVYCSIGLHPLHVEEESTTTEELVSLATSAKVIGIGETGLDYYYEAQNRDKQIRSFIEHIKAAQATGLPIIIHTRDAEDDTIEILRAMLKKKVFTGVIHCFTGSERLAHAALDMGFYISASGIITFKKSDMLRKVFKSVPLDKLLVETDAPYLTPMPHRGKTNEPAFVKYTAHCIADLYGEPFETVCRITTDNFFKLFSRALLPRDSQLHALIYR